MQCLNCQKALQGTLNFALIAVRKWLKISPVIPATNKLTNRQVPVPLSF